MNTRILLLLILALALTQCVSARSPVRDPLRVLRHHPHLASFPNVAGPSANVSNCGNTECNSDDDCPSFSEFYDAQCLPNNTCEYTPSWVDGLCNNTLQCNTHTCTCEAYLSNGCECNYYGDFGPCDYFCLNDVCQQAFGFVGEYCDKNYQCRYGACTNNTCLFLQEGEACPQELYGRNCAPNLYCASNNQCAPAPPCSEENLWNGTCPWENEVCFNGTCFPIFGNQPIGEPCIVELTSCAIDLACVSDGTSQWGVCENVTDGTPCTSDSDCALTQACLCVEANDSLPMQCVPSHFDPIECKKVIQNYLACNTNNCMYYDLVPGTPCYDSCYSQYTEMLCCMVCNNQQYYDNAIFNYAGSCVTNTLKAVECCSDTLPCTILPVADLCAGY